MIKYQEQPQLLDGCLEGVVQPLAALLRDHAAAAAPPPGAGGAHPGTRAAAAEVGAVCGVCRLLHVLVTVRGHKTVVRFFPHEAADLERVLQVRAAGPVAAASGPCAAGPTHGAAVRTAAGSGPGRPRRGAAAGAARNVPGRATSG
jgi:hypothetical protein